MEVKIRLPFAGSYPVTQMFGENPETYVQFGKPGHNGIDFGMPIGTEIIAAADGDVVKVGWDEKGYGNYVHLQHQGFSTLYAHLSEVVVTPNQSVIAGEVIGLSGNTGFSTGPHLHFELRIPRVPGAYNRGEVDPLQYISAVENLDQSQILKSDTYTVQATVLNIRKEPSMKAAIVGQLHYGDQVKVDSIEGNWAKVTFYISTDWIK